MSNHPALPRCASCTSSHVTICSGWLYTASGISQRGQQEHASFDDFPHHRDHELLYKHSLEISTRSNAQESNSTFFLSFARPAANIRNLPFQRERSVLNSLIKLANFCRSLAMSVMPNGKHTNVKERKRKKGRKKLCPVILK